jgi:nitrite reductase/ring-hydroxylating ferredoxin subunit
MHMITEHMFTADCLCVQDYCIECPSTGSLFSLKDGSIVSWYPNNPVLRALTPQDTCRKMDIYPVKLTQVRAAAAALAGKWHT